MQGAGATRMGAPRKATDDVRLARKRARARDKKQRQRARRRMAAEGAAVANAGLVDGAPVATTGAADSVAGPVDGSPEPQENNDSAALGGLRILAAGEAVPPKAQTAVDLARTLVQVRLEEARRLGRAAYERAASTPELRASALAWSARNNAILYVVVNITDGEDASGAVYTGQTHRSEPPMACLQKRTAEHLNRVPPRATAFDCALQAAPAGHVVVLVHVHESRTPGLAAAEATMDFLEDCVNAGMVAAGIRSLNSVPVGQRQPAEWSGDADRWTKLVAALRRFQLQHGDLVVPAAAKDEGYGTGEAFGHAVKRVRKSGYLIAGIPERRSLLVEMGFDFGDTAADTTRRARIARSRQLVEDLLEFIGTHKRLPAYRGSERRLAGRYGHWMGRQPVEEGLRRVQAALEAAQVAPRSGPIDRWVRPVSAPATRSRGNVDGRGGGRT